MEYIEIIEKTVEDAITAACRKLSVTSDRLDYVVVDEGSQGFLGIGARNAVIKARVKGEEEAAPEPKTQEPAQTMSAAAFDEAPAAPAGEAWAPVSASAPTGEHKPRRRSRGGSRKQEDGARAEDTSAEDAAEKKPVRKAKKQETRPLTPEEIMSVKERADSFLTQVFQAMGMDVSIDLDYNEEDHILTTSFVGEDMGVLIGKRGQTLDSLQYLVSLVVNKGMDTYIHVKADTENYRERRKKTLENLAKNVAGRVKRTGHEVKLEPMNPYERRIIHSALQADRFCTTYSEGEEPFRRVVVTPKK